MSVMKEEPPRNPMDYVSLFMGRVAMAMIVLIVVIMMYEIFMRYVVESATLWVNGTSVWMCAFVFLFSGLYAMQQRSHIRIFILYDLCPRWLQRLLDTISTLLICAFAFSMVWGGFGEASSRFQRWERFGETWRFEVYSLSDGAWKSIPYDPPIPATLKPMILLVVVLVALQAIVNLIADWSKDKELHLPSADD